MYKPDAEIVPTWGEIDQLTAPLAEPLTVAVNCWGDDEAVKLTVKRGKETTEISFKTGEGL